MGTTPLLWFVNSGSGGDLRKHTERSDLPRRGGEPERIGEENEVSIVGRSDDRLHEALTTFRLNRPNHFRRDDGRAVVGTDLGDKVPKKVLRTLPVATYNSKKKLIVLCALVGMLPTHRN